MSRPPSSRIEAVDGFFLERPPGAPGARPEHCFLLRIRTEDGAEGWGEAHGSPYMLRAAVDAPFTHVTAQGLRHLLRGAEAENVNEVRHRMDRGTQWVGRDGTMAQAIAAAEAALWDLQGQRAGLPVWQLLRDGTQRPPAIRAYASGKVGATPELTHARLRRERDAGFDAFKIGWPPFGTDPDTDCAFLDAARDAVGDRTLMVDAAQAWAGWEQTAARLQRFAPYRLHWVEEPLNRDDLTGLARLRTSSTTPLAAGEGECSLRGLLALVDGCVDVLQPDATRCGIGTAQAAAQAALGRGLGVASHSFTTGLNVTMHLHLLAALDTPDALLEWPAGQLALWATLFPDTPHPIGGRLAVPDAPGWGLKPDADVLHRLTMPR